jgi:hypothetical protein
MPSQSTYSRFFGRISQVRNTEVFPELQKWFFSQIKVGAVTVDFDSTVISREGSQQGSAKGYNPNRRGRNSHHPLIAFISQTRMVANAWLRPGNTAACSNCVEFMRETFDQALEGVKVGLVHRLINNYKSLRKLLHNLLRNAFVQEWTKQRVKQDMKRGKVRWRRCVEASR